MNSRGLGIVAVTSLLLSACTSPPAPSKLAADQVLRLVASQDVQTLDPAKTHQPTVELSLIRNVFGGLYRFSDNLSEVPDLASGMPEVSADGLVWKFHLRTNARFSNGDSVTSADVLYSWNRMAALTAYGSSSIFEPVAGSSAIATGQTKTLSGLTAPDDHTVVARLTAPAGWWIVELGLWAAAVIDKKVVGALGEDAWWSTPEGLIGTGPFRMSKRDPGHSLDFEPVPSWWDGPTGHLKRVHVDVVTDQAAQIDRYAAGGIDIVGYAPTDAIAQIADETVKRFRSDQHTANDLYLRSWLRTSHLGFPGSGRMSSDADLVGRRALSLALDRERLAATCFEGGECAPATGGLIYKGLAGYLGDSTDPNAKHDVSAAKTLLGSWDPDGSRRKSLRMGAPSRYGALAGEVKTEWQAALGLNVELEVADGATFGHNASAGRYDMVVVAFIADFDSPQNWFSGGTNWCPAALRNPQMTTLLGAADKKLPTDALEDYKQAGRLLLDAAACPPLVYQQGVYLIKPWVRGAGGNALYEYSWTSISIIEH